MAIGDPYEVHYNEKRERYFVKRGNETFYDEDNNWIMFNTKDEAMSFVMEQVDRNSQALGLVYTYGG